MKQAVNCTAQQVAAAPGANCFSFDTVLLVSEGEGNVVCACEGGDGVTSGAEDMAITPEGDVAEAERDGFVLGLVSTNSCKVSLFSISCITRSKTVSVTSE